MSKWKLLWPLVWDFENLVEWVKQMMFQTSVTLSSCKWIHARTFPNHVSQSLWSRIQREPSMLVSHLLTRNCPHFSICSFSWWCLALVITPAYMIVEAQPAKQWLKGYNSDLNPCWNIPGYISWLPDLWCWALQRH